MLKRSFFGVFFLGVALLFGCSTIDNRKLSKNNDSLQSDRGLAGAKAASLIRPHADFVLVKAGKFKMGSPKDEYGRYDDELLHGVILTKDFEIQTTEVTQRQWFHVMGDNPSYFKPSVAKSSLVGIDYSVRIDDAYCPETAIIKRRYTLCPEHPVENVSWQDVQRFIKRLNKSSQAYVYRLPTEAEWEYAAREEGSSTTPFNLGDNISSDRVNYYTLRNANYGSSAKGLFYREQTVAVGSLDNANSLGIFDMHGNVRERVQDFHGEYPNSGFSSSTSVKDPKGPSSGWHIARGGSWAVRAQNARSAYRSRTSQSGFSSVVDSDLGFRLVRTAKRNSTTPPFYNFR